jgi:hypothetical protein
MSPSSPVAHPQWLTRGRRRRKAPPRPEFRRQLERQLRRRIHQQCRQTASTPPELASQTPASATAQCGDGPYSYSQSRRGTCSSHGGAPAWLEHSSFDSRHMTATELSYQEDKTHEQRAAAFTFRDCTRSRVLGERITSLRLLPRTVSVSSYFRKNGTSLRHVEVATIGRLMPR